MAKFANVNMSQVCDFLRNAGTKSIGQLDDECKVMDKDTLAYLYDTLKNRQDIALAYMESGRKSAR